MASFKITGCRVSGGSLGIESERVLSNRRPGRACTHVAPAGRAYRSAETPTPPTPDTPDLFFTPLTQMLNLYTRKT